MQQKDDGDKALLDTIKEKGEITIAMEGTWAPWTFHDEEDVLTGYDTEVGKLIAEGLGVEPVFVEGEWDGLLAGIDAGRYDIMINGVDVTPEHSVEPYAAIVPQDNIAHKSGVVCQKTVFSYLGSEAPY